jgi:pyruvate dehydrogenase (quinone)
LNQVTWEQRAMSGFPKFEDSQNLPEFPYAVYAEMLGLKGIRVKEPDEVAAAWELALAEQRPVVIDAYTDPEVPTIPPHISIEQATNYAKSIIKGDPDSRDMIRQSYKEMADSWFPHPAHHPADTESSH